MTIRNISILSIWFIALFSCSNGQNNNTSELQKKLITHNVRDLDTWFDYQNKSMLDRVVPASSQLVDYLRIDNKLNGYTPVPKSATHWKGFAKDVQAAINEFPTPVQDQLKAHVIGIFLVTNLGSSGYSELLRDFSQNKKGFIVLDVENLSLKANAWATWKENTPFQLSKDIEINALIANDLQNNRKVALSYIILHELGHLVGVAKKAHSSWWNVSSQTKYGFSSISWKLSEQLTESKWEDVFPERKSIRFYANQDKKTPSTDIPIIYRNWQKSDFVSLYASTGVYDDFAETYAMYVHVVMQGRPWQVTLIQDEEIIGQFNTPILNSRGKDKRAYIASIFEEKP